MKRKPEFTAKLKQAKDELEAEINSDTNRIERTSITIEAHLLYELKQIVAKRRYKQQKPDTISGIIREALVEFIKREKT